MSAELGKPSLAHAVKMIVLRSHPLISIHVILLLLALYLYNNQTLPVVPVMD
jgi:hypothetical protein